MTRPLPSPPAGNDPGPRRRVVREHADAYPRWVGEGEAPMPSAPLPSERDVRDGRIIPIELDFDRLGRCDPVEAAEILLEASEHFWPIALRARGERLPDGTLAKGKEPLGNKWGAARWSADRLAKAIRQRDGRGIGLGLGPQPGIIDVDVDGERGEDSLRDLFGGPIPQTLGWSSMRGVHRLFAYDPRFASFRVNKIDGIAEFPDLEFRFGCGKQTQSACPPTPGEDGRRRTWIGSDRIAAFPDHALARLMEVRGIRPAEEPEKMTHSQVTESVSLSGDLHPDPAVNTRLWHAILRTMPTGEGQRNRCIGRFAFRVRKIHPDLRRGEDEAIVRAWYGRAIPVIRTKEFADTLADFRIAWGRYRPPPPESKPRRALVIAESDPTVYHPDPGCNSIARLMRAMASLSTEPDKRFPLSCHQMEDLLGIPYRTANRKAEQLAREGLVELVERGQAGPGSGKAHCWRWIDGA